MRSRNSDYDVLIVGAGPIGLACAIEARKRGFSYLTVEKGCLVNSIFHFPVNMTFFSTADRLELGEVPFISQGSKPTRSEALNYYRRVVEALRLNVKTYERVLDVKGKKGEFYVRTEKAVYGAKTVILATGFYDHPNLLNIPGEDLPIVKHYYDDPHLYAFKKVAVIGAGNSAVQAALETLRCSAQVTMIIREPNLSEKIKYWIKPDIENRIKEGAITAYFNSVVKRIEEEKIDVQTPKGDLQLNNDFVLALTGYHPDYSFLEKLGIEISRDETKSPFFNEKNFETNRKGIFLAGVVCGGMETARWLIENSREHAVRIFDFLANDF